MGAGIHLYVERNEGDNENAVWVPVYSELADCLECDGTTENIHDAWCKNCRAGPEDHDEVTKRCFMGPLLAEIVVPPCQCLHGWAPPGKREVWESAFYSGRDYGLFGVLANVRGGPHTGFTEERGIPDDASPQYRRVAEGPDWHSHTWYFLKELVACQKLREFPSFMQTVRRLKEMSDGTYWDIRVLMFFDN